MISEANALRILAQCIEDGGCTWDRSLNELVTARFQGYAVGIRGHVLNLDTRTYNEIVTKIREVDCEAQTRHIGLWIEENALYIDETVVVDSIKDAMALARKEDQRAIYNFANGEVMEVEAWQNALATTTA